MRSGINRPGHINVSIGFQRRPLRGHVRFQGPPLAGESTKAAGTRHGAYVCLGGSVCVSDASGALRDRQAARVTMSEQCLEPANLPPEHGLQRQGLRLLS